MKGLPSGHIGHAAMAGLLYCAMAFVSIRLMSPGGGIAMIWPCNGLMVALLLTRSRARWWPYLATAFAGGIAANGMAHGLSSGAFAYGAVNVVDIVMASLAAERISKTKGTDIDPRMVVQYLARAGLFAAGVGSMAGAATATYFYGQPFLQSYGLWYLMDALSLFVFTPFFFSLFSGRLRRHLRERSQAERVHITALLVLTIFVAVVAFQSEKPVLFFITMPMMLVVFRLGQIGTEISMAAVTVIGAIATATGNGPIVALSKDPITQGLYLQIFLMAQILTQWPIGAALEARDRFMLGLKKSERSLRDLAAQSSVLMLTFDTGGVCRKAIGAPGLLTGTPVDAMPGALIEALSVEGAATLRSGHELAMDVPDFVHSVEFAVGDGRHRRWLEASFRGLDDEEGRCPGTQMTLHDISVRKEQALALALSAQTDGLTGLLNRSGFLTRLNRAVGRSTGETLSLAMIDVDRFKSINDNLGHQVGDAVLAEIANRLGAELRSSDVVARLGGDEFVVLLETTDHDRAQEISGRLVAAVGDKPFALPSGEILPVAISCGLARYRPGQTVPAFLHAADIALYAAKRAGRNRLVAT